MEEMNNDLQIKPLLEYELTFSRYGGYADDPERATEKFTAESYEVNRSQYGPTSLRFFRTGNLIREYFETPVKIVATPSANVEG